MRQITAVLLLLASFSAVGQGETQAFLSWYDGWGTHTVWGAGEISGSYNGTVIRCGDVSIPVRPVLDTHESDGNPPSSTRTAEHARSVNVPLLRSLESRGDKCIFQQAGSFSAGSIPRVSDVHHVVYLHGKIVQQHGKNAVSPEYGPYLFDEIVTGLGKNGAKVHAPIRTGEPTTDESAKQVAALVDQLLSSGVPANKITIVGASLGAVIAMRVSVAMKNPSLRFVLLGACSDWVRDELKPDLHGHILSIYEEGDPYGASCGSVVAGKPGISSFDELRLTTGLSHGFLYRPLPEWVEPALRWSTLPGASADNSPAG